MSVGAGRLGDGRWQCRSYSAPDECAIADTAGCYRYRQSGEILLALSLLMKLVSQVCGVVWSDMHRELLCGLGYPATQLNIYKHAQMKLIAELTG